jgi:alpha-L-fucosidase
MNIGVLQHHYMPVYDRSYIQNNMYAQAPIPQPQIYAGNLINDIRNTFKTNEYYEQKEYIRKKRPSADRIYFDLNGVPISNKENKSYSDSSKKTNSNVSKRTTIYSAHEYNQYINGTKIKPSKTKDESISRSSRVLFTQSTP